MRSFFVAKYAAEYVHTVPFNPIIINIISIIRYGISAPGVKREGRVANSAARIP